MLRKDKEQVVTELAERLRSSQTLILADYRGLSVSELDEVRTKLLEHGARFHVVKNTLTKRAADEAGFETLKELLDGPTAIAFVGDGDMVSVAKTLSETARKTKILELKGGILEGTPMDARPGGRARQAPAGRRAARTGAGRDRRPADRDRQPLRGPGAGLRRVARRAYRAARRGSAGRGGGSGRGGSGRRGRDLPRKRLRLPRKRPAAEAEPAAEEERAEEADAEAAEAAPEATAEETQESTEDTAEETQEEE